MELNGTVRLPLHALDCCNWKFEKLSRNDEWVVLKKARLELFVLCDSRTNNHLK